MEEVYKYDTELLGVNSRNDVAERFANFYCELANMKYIIHTGLRILLLEKLETGNLLDDVIYRKAKLEDKETLIKYIQNFMKEALQEECEYEKAEEKFFKYLNKRFYVFFGCKAYKVLV